MEEKKLRSNILVYWTGKDICLNLINRELCTDHIRNEYLKRLESILKDGFWMKIPDELIFGDGGCWLSYKAHMTCFTEIPTQKSFIHSQKYGLLGIGVDRKFVLERRGGPVQYVRNNNREAVVNNYKVLFDLLMICKKTLGERIKEFPELVSFLGDKKFTDYCNYLGVNSSFIKGMSNHHSDDFEILEEQEWRIVHTFKTEIDDKLIKKTGYDKPKYIIPVNPEDIRVIIFPDAATKTKTINEKWFQVYFGDNHIPELHTLDECHEF